MVATRLHMDDDAARTLLSQTRQIEPTITAREVVHLGIAKLEQMNGTTRNRVGLLLKALPKTASGATLSAARRSAAEEIERERRDTENKLKTAEDFLKEETDPQNREWLESDLAAARGTLA